MSLWSATDANTGAPKFAVASGLGSSANGLTAYQNVQSGAFVAGACVGVFGVDANEASNTSFEGSDVTHAGWVLRKEGTGGVITITVTNVGTNVNSGANGWLIFTGGGNGSGVNAAYTVNAANANCISTITIANPGTGYNLAAITANVGNTLGTGGASYNVKPTFTVTVGGRAGRVQYETLVAMGSMSRDANTDDTIMGG